MQAYMVRRLLHSLLVLWAVVTFTFFLVRLSGDPAALMLPETATPADLQAMRRHLGLDQPMLTQYAGFLGRVARGDFGVSLRHDVPSMTLVLQRAPATLELTGVAVALTLLVAVPVGVIAATQRNSWLDQASRTVAVVGQCTPIFWFGILLIILFAVHFRIVPPFGRGTWRHMILPGITLALYSAPVTMRMLRSNLLDVLETDYVRTARAKGLARRVVLFKHAVRNAAIPVLTVFALRIGVLLGGSVIAEQVFAYPGMGQLVLQAILQRDYPVVQAFVLTIAVVIVSLNLFLDLAYVVLDPRIRLAG